MNGGGDISDIRYDLNQAKEMRANEQCQFTLQPLTDSEAGLKSASQCS